MVFIYDVFIRTLLCVRITRRAIKRRILERRGYVRALVALAAIEDNRLAVSYNYVLAASTPFFYVDSFKLLYGFTDG